MQLIAPGNEAASTKVSQIFRWQPLEGAREYRLLIGSPSLLNASDFFLDTITAQTSLRVILRPGRFEWQISARNAGYESASVARLLQIDPSSNLAEQSFRLLSPTNSSVLKSNVVSFQWEALPMADRYVFILDNQPGDTLLTNRTTKTLPAETRSYSWQVRALNASSQKDADQAFTFQVDLNIPTQPTLLNPQNNSSLQSLPVTLSWQRSAANIMRDSIYLYTANQTTIIAGFPRSVNATSYTLQQSNISLGAGTYYWAIKSVGSNGQVSGLSEKRSFSLQF